jgi:superfamily II DNA or RNA helicase
MELREYQQKVVNDIYSAWDAGAQNVMVQMATGAGKTVVFCHVLAACTGGAIAIAHRVELVSQISLTLARYGIRHNILAPKSSIREIVSIHMAELGRSWYDPHSQVRVAGVATLVRIDPATPWLREIRLVVQDEGHHCTKKSQWGRAAEMFPNARGLYPTATPLRLDGKGLGRHADGVCDVLITGPTMRDLISMGYLTDYRIFAPPSDLDLANVPLALGGDFSPKPLRAAVGESHITGDVVAHYLRIAPGLSGVTFAVSVEAACDIAQAFNAAGVVAEVVTAKTPDLLRASIMRRFRAGEIRQLVNVDLLGEGVDVPAIQVVSFARPTHSFALYSQAFGRALRPLAGKKHAIVIDHVGNVMRHGLPDAPRVWSLDRRDRRTRGKPLDEFPVTTCLNPQCFTVYQRTRSSCPVCGFKPVARARSTPEQVDGDLLELDADALAALRGEINRIDGMAKIPQGLSAIAQLAVGKRHHERQQAQGALRDTIAQWAGYLHTSGCSDSEILKRFYFRFGIDIMTAQTLGAREANELKEKLLTALSNQG